LFWRRRRKGQPSPKAGKSEALQKPSLTLRTTCELVGVVTHKKIPSLKEHLRMIVVENFSFCYEGAPAPTLKNINLAIEPGAFVGITGPAGCGKSTLTCALNGIIPHCYHGDYWGHVRVCGQDVVEASLTDISRLVGSVCQDIDSQMVSSVVEDEILYGLENFGVAREEIEARVAWALESMGISELRTRAIDSLSGGQKQKVALAAIVALRPQVLVLDEPTAELDPASSRAVFGLLREYSRASGATVVVVEQKIALLAEFANMLVILEAGQVRFAGSPAEVLAHSEELLELGVNCPRSTTVVNELRARGLYAGAPVANVAGAVRACEEALS
jgi:energy-coupling factor transport system ATP-binding protein